MDELRKVIDVNLIGMFLGVKTMLPLMRAAGGGSIVNVPSIAGLKGDPDGTAYNSSKFAVRGFTKVAALELARDAIRVNSVHPGIVETPMLAGEDAGEVVHTLAAQVPLGRLGTPEEVTNLVLFLASDASSYATGSEFVMDGGIMAG